jgi:amino acid permease
MILSLLCNEPNSVSCITPIKVKTFISIFSLIVACIPSLKTFAYISTLSILIMFASLILMFYHSSVSLSHFDDLQIRLGRETFLFDIAMFPQSMGILLYAFEGITLYMPLRATYHNHTNFHSFFIGTLIFISVFVFIFGTPLYYDFYTDTKEIIFLNFDNSYILLLLMKIVYLTVVFISNPINLFPLYKSFLSMRDVKDHLSKKSNSYTSIFKLVIRLVITFLCILIACMIPSFIRFISFVGSFFFGLLGIILPIMLYISIFSKYKKLTLLDLISKVFVLVISCVIFGFSTVFSFRNLIKGNSE